MAHVYNIFLDQVRTMQECSYCSPMSNFSLCDVCSVPSQSQSPTQDQYVFIHDAVLESLTCGDTQILASRLSGAIKKLKQKDRVNILMFCEFKVHLYDKQASVFAFGIF